MHDRNQPTEDRTAAAIAFQTAASEAALLGQRDVEVRPFTFEDISALASRIVHGDFDAYRADSDGNLTAVRVEVANHHGAPRVNITFAMNPVTGNLDRSAPVGARIRVDITTCFGAHSQGFLFTTEEAEEASGFGSSQDPGRLRESLYLPTDNPFDAIPDADAGPASQFEHRLLAPVYGSAMDVFCVIKGAAPSDLETRVREILTAEFGDAIGAVVSIATKPVHDTRVDVFDAETGRPLAVGVLHAESIYLRPQSDSGLVETRPAANTGLIVGR